MLLIGLDAAAQYENFGYAIARLNNTSLELTDFGTIRSEDQLENLVSAHIDPREPALLAVDAPLGWPRAFGSALAPHQAGHALSVPSSTFFRRETDDFVHAKLGKRPLDVAADRIARASWRALHVLGSMRHHLGCPLPLAWSHVGINEPSVIEVYPAGTLISRQRYVPGYGKPEAVGARDEIATALLHELPGITKTTSSCHAFDAALCLLAAKDFLSGLAAPPDSQARAEIEGWIWVRLLG